MRTIQEILLAPIPYQEILLGETTEILSVAVRLGGISLFAIIEDREPRTELTGIYILPTGDPQVADVPNTFAFMGTFQFKPTEKLDVLHVFVQIHGLELLQQENEDDIDANP